MRVLLLDTKQIVERDENEAIRMILADVAVEAPMERQSPPESAMLDRPARTATKPQPQPRPPAPAREKRRKKR